MYDEPPFRLRVYDDAKQLAVATKDVMVRAVSEAIARRGVFTVALSGGSSPRAAYELFSRESLDWPCIHLFWGDERCVPPDDERSNYEMARNALLEQASIPAENVHRMRGELGAEEGAEDYARTLLDFFGRPPVFDLVLLGIGPDGHTASLFPGTAALEADGVVTGVPAPPLDPPVERITLTFPVLSAAREVLFLAAGENKKDIVASVLQDPASPYPAARVRPKQPPLWLVDGSAAAALRDI